MLTWQTSVWASLNHCFSVSCSVPSGSLLSEWFPTSSACWRPSLSAATLGENAMFFVDKLVSRMSAKATEEVHNDPVPIESVLSKLQQRNSSALMYNPTLIGAKWLTSECGWILTKVVDFDWGHFADVPLDEKIYVRQDDEGRSQRRPGVVLHDQIVTLELPVDVAVGLHFREGVAGADTKESQTSACLSDHRWDRTIASLSRHFLPEHGDEQVYKQDVGNQQINNQQNYHQPITVRNSARLCTCVNQCHVVCTLHVPRLPHWSRHKVWGRLKLFQ